MYKFLIITTHLIHTIFSAVVGVDSGSLHIRMFHYDNRSKDYAAITDENSTSSILNMHSVNQDGQFNFGKGTSNNGYVVPFGIQALYNLHLYPYISQIATYNLNLSTTQQSGDKIPTDALPEDVKMFASGNAPQTDTVLLERIYAYYFNYLQDLAKSSKVHYFPVTFSIPNYMSTLTREIIKKTSQEVNFKIFNLVVEEHALALGVAEKLDSSKMDSFVVIVDMGHVSSNFTIIRAYSTESYKELHPDFTEKGKRVVEVIRTQNTDFNGLKVTLLIYNNLKNKIENNSKKLDEQEKNKLLIISNKLKSKLSTAQKTKTLFSRTDGSLIELTIERSVYEEDINFNKSLENYFLELNDFINAYIEESGIKKFFVVPFGGHSLLPSVKAKFNTNYKSKLLPFLKPTTDLGQYLTLYQLQKNMMYKPEARILVKEILNKKYVMKLIKEDTNEIIVEKTLWELGDIMEGKKEVEALLKKGDYRVIIHSKNSTKEELEADFEFLIDQDIQTIVVFSFNGFRNVQYHITTEQTIDNKIQKRRITKVKNFPLIDENSLKEIKEEIKKFNKVKEENKLLSENRNKLDSMIYDIVGELENEESVYLEFGKESEINKLKDYLVVLEKEFEEHKFDEDLFNKERIGKEITEINKMCNVIKNREKEKERMEIEIKESKEFYNRQKKEIEEKIEKWIKEKEEKDNKEEENKKEDESKEENKKEDESKEEHNKEESKEESKEGNKEEQNKKEESKEEQNKEGKEKKKKLNKIERYSKLKDTIVKRLEQIENLDINIKKLPKNEDAKVTSKRLKTLKRNFEKRRSRIDQSIMKQELWSSPEMKKMMENLIKQKQKEAEEEKIKEQKEADEKDKENDEKINGEDEKEAKESKEENKVKDDMTNDKEKNEKSKENESTDKNEADKEDDNKKNKKHKKKKKENGKEKKMKQKMKNKKSKFEKKDKHKNKDKKKNKKTDNSNLDEEDL